MCLRLVVGCVLGSLVLGLVLQAVGCSSLTIPEAPPRSTPMLPLWSEEAFLEHLRFFNGSEVAGRATGTAGYATAAAYVAARMNEFELQPAVGPTAQVLYPVSINEVQNARLTEINGDTLAFYAGVDFLADGRSDSGRVEIYTLTVDPAGLTEVDAVAGAAAVLLASEKARTAYLERLRDTGVQVAFVVGRLVPRPSPASIRGLMVVQVRPETAARLLRTTPANMSAFLAGSNRIERSLLRPVRLQVETQLVPNTGAINILGYVAGKHPERARELVIVCSDLDAVGTFAGVPTLDAAHLGVGTAALLEVARQYSTFAQFSSVPERTLLFAVFSGSRQAHVGLKAYLRQPTWPLDHTRAVLYVGLDPADEPAVRDVLSGYDLPLYAVTPPADTLGARELVLQPLRRPPRARTLRPEGVEASRRTPPRLTDLVEAGVVRARAMAEATHTLLLREAVTGASLIPVNPDTLATPNSE